MIQIDISSKIAQFRNFFYNSSIVSYPFLPRTSALGFLASILDKEHDSYYDDFKDSKIAICLQTPIAKELKTLNHLKTDGVGHTQRKSEYIVSQNEKNLTYRLYYQGKNEKEILQNIKQGKGYHRYLGTTECLAQIDNFKEVDCEAIEPKDSIYIDSVLPIDIIESLDFQDEKRYFHYEKNRIIYNFANDRKSLGVVDILTETKELKIKAKLKTDLGFDVSDKLRIQGKLLEVANTGDIVFVF